ncbi:hypothetical protein PMN64_18075 [Bradyrhizobium sp. UFLA01-814]|uniref:hypothetical protein n=1 Tax=Bradyrhizobium sp. UFLA01-814 TaxID=3023480 RepID=UPI00398B74A5
MKWFMAAPFCPWSGDLRFAVNDDCDDVRDGRFDGKKVIQCQWRCSLIYSQRKPLAFYQKSVIGKKATFQVVKNRPAFFRV